MTQPLDPRRLKPGQLLTLVNSTPLGQVLTEAALRKIRQAAGTAIGDGQTIDFFRFTNWLVHRRHTPPATASQGSAAAPEDADAYSRHKARARDRNAALSRSGRDIGPIPAVADPARRGSCERNFSLFCKTYLPGTFALPWSKNHKKCIAKIERSTLEGGLFAFAMPRRRGKTSLCEAAALWALVYGHRKFCVLIGAASKMALDSLDSIKAELETNETLAADFPEVCLPIMALEGRANKCSGQHTQGKRTHIVWGKRMLVLPTVEGSAASGGILRVEGIDGAIRGMKVKTSGQPRRPDFVLLDDPQTDKSARSLSQVNERLKTIFGTILYLSGPGVSISGFMPCTVIRQDDVADQVLDRDKHPEFQGERFQMLEAFPERMDLWDQYHELLRQSYLNDGDGSEATTFYSDNRAVMDGGAVVDWEQFFEKKEISALQNAMNLYYRDRASFMAECQQQPISDLPTGTHLLSIDQICAKVGGLPRGQVPDDASHITAFIDVQGSLLYFLVAAWRSDFTGHVLDYGAWPDQHLSYFTLSNAKNTLGAPGQGLEAAIYAGLESLVNRLASHEWTRPGGGIDKISRLLIDANWGESTDVVYQFCRQSPHAAVLMPSHGQFVGASSLPFDKKKKQKGDIYGRHWYIPSNRGRRALRHVMIDTNYWKSFVHARLATSMGDPGCLSLFGQAGHVDHRMIAEHWRAEYPIRVAGRGRELDEWKQMPTKPDNHLLDGIVGAAVAASMQGVSLAATGPTRPASGGDRKPVSLSELQAQKRGRA